MNRLLPTWVTDQAAKAPERRAVVMGDSTLSYGELDAASNRLARLIKDSGCRRGDRVGMLIPKGPTALVGMLGIYKADCIHVPLDPAGPAPRLTKILRSCEPRLILAAGPVARLLDEIFAGAGGRRQPRVGWMEDPAGAGEHFTSSFSLRDVRGSPAEPLEQENGHHDPAHLLYTSGSTGVPKGVIITHENVVRFVEWGVKYFGLSPMDRISSHSPLHFDLSTFDIFGAFAAGAELHLVPPQLNLLPNRLAEFIRGSRLTQWFSVPSVLAYMARLDVVRFQDFPALKRLLWCGDVLPTPVLIHLMERLPHVSFTNLYGPTEATIASSYYTVPARPWDSREIIPIGRPCEGEELLVLDEELRRVPAGQVGELCIRGVGLSPGYWDDPERTRQAFVRGARDDTAPDRLYRTGDLAWMGEDGLAYFVGRADTQVKCCGHRIELGEVEAALHSLALVQDVAVVAIQGNGFEGAGICCAYVPAAQSVAPAAVGAALRRLLPGYMVPRRWMACERLPTNANGKVDRGKLRRAFERSERSRDEAGAAPDPQHA